jgi:pimeloyl-ACP methyl ester carboxylesterase
MSSSKVSFICVPGGFCPGHFFHKVVPLLQSRGYDAHALELPSIDSTLKQYGERPGMYDDGTHVRNTVTKVLDEGSDVVLVASSYGGAVAFEACKGITAAERRKEKKSGGELKHLILLGSFVTEPGKTVQELVGANVPVDTEVGDSDGPVVSHSMPPPPALVGAGLYASLPEEEQEVYGNMLRPMSTQAFLEPMTFAAWKEVPTTMVIGKNDVVLAPEIQHEYYNKAVEGGTKGLRKVVIEGGDHLTMLSHPEEVVKVCLEAAGADV